MLRKVKLHGELAKFVGQHEFEAVISTPAEAIRFLVSNFPKLEAYMANRHYQVLIGNEEIGEKELHNPMGDEVNIVPVIAGAGSGASRVLLGGLLIGASFLFSPLTFANFGTTAMGFGSAAGIAKGVAVIGGALVLNGITELLFPLPTPDAQEDDPRRS